MMPPLPTYAPRELNAERLPLVFPEGTPNRNYCVRELAASTVFTALYVGAVEGADRFLGPVHVYRMTAEQATRADADQREAYDRVIRKKAPVPGVRWYADNTREPIRDETLRDGLVAIGAVTRREDLPTTSGAARYALKSDFAVLFNPALQGAVLERAITAFQTKHLSKSALARVSIMLAGTAGSAANILVTFPNGETRQLEPSLSSIISRSVIQVFAKRFLEQPVVLWLSESGNKIVVRDESVANAIGLRIEADKNLPDLILADLGPPEPLLVFVEVVATDGAITPRRQDAIHAITDAAGFKKTVAQLAWDSFAWFVSEPDRIIVLRDGGRSPARLAELIGGAP